MTAQGATTDEHYRGVFNTGAEVSFKVSRLWPGLRNNLLELDGLRHIVELYNDHYTPEMLHDHFPTLALALVHKVIAFYLENTAEVDAYMQQSREALNRQAAAPRRGPDAAELQRRMEAQRPKESA